MRDALTIAEGASGIRAGGISGGARGLKSPLLDGEATGKAAPSLGQGEPSAGPDRGRGSASCGATAPNLGVFLLCVRHIGPTLADSKPATRPIRTRNLRRVRAPHG